MSYFGDNEDRIVYGSRRKSRDFDVACSRCRKTGLKWRLDADGWRLYENARVEHNRLKPHQCDETTLDDFEALP